MCFKFFNSKTIDGINRWFSNEKQTKQRQSQNQNLPFTCLFIYVHIVLIYF